MQEALEFDFEKTVEWKAIMIIHFLYNSVFLYPPYLHYIHRGLSYKYNDFSLKL